MLSRADIVNAKAITARHERADQEADDMRAKAGDELIVKGRRQGDEDRFGEIVEVHGDDGSPPYLVRWRDGRESVFFPASDTVVEHRPAITRNQ